MKCSQWAMRRFEKMCEEQVEAVGGIGVSVLFVSH
jgi:hypothetical protein